MHEPHPGRAGSGAPFENFLGTCLMIPACLERGREDHRHPGAHIQFPLPGILVQTIVFITVYTGVGLNSDIQKGLYDRFRSLPMWQPAPIIGALAGDLFRYAVASTLTIVLGVILGFRPAAGVVGVLLAFGLVPGALKR
jgi:hypothetical protein